VVFGTSKALWEKTTNYAMIYAMGTVINVVAIIVGGIFGLLFGKRISDSAKDSILKANGVAVIILAIGGVMSKYLHIDEDGSISTVGTMMMILSLAIGTLIGEFIGIDKAITNFGEWLKVKTKSEGDNSFVNAFVLASCTVCIGAMAVVGSMEDGITGDYSILLAKSILDLIIILIMTASLGKGCIFSAIPVGLFQGSITLLAVFLGSFVPEASLDNLSLVGNVLIFCVGINLVWDLKIKVANMLPALIIAMFWIFIPM